MTDKPEEVCADCGDRACGAGEEHAAPMGAIRYGLLQRRRVREHAPYRKCWRCQLSVTRELVSALFRRELTARGFTVRVIAAIGGYRSRHPVSHCRWFGECVDLNMHAFAEFVDREVAHTEMSCQGDDIHPAWLIITSGSWPSLHEWLLEDGYAVGGQIDGDQPTRASMRKLGWDVVTESLFDPQFDVVPRTKVLFDRIPAPSVAEITAKTGE